MSLSNDIKNAFLKSMGYDDIEDQDAKKTMENSAENLGLDISKAVVDFLQKQEFTITKMKAIVKLDELTTTGPLDADIKTSVQTNVPPMTFGLPTPPMGGAIGHPAPIPISVSPMTAKKGVTIPKIKLNKTGGQGGSMNAFGYAYVGRNNPVSPNESNEDKTVVQLIDVVDE